LETRFSSKKGYKILGNLQSNGTAGNFRLDELKGKGGVKIQID